MKDLLLKLLFSTGILGLYHRMRNKRVLTVVSLHRVIAVSDPRWNTCDPLYTLSDRIFDQCAKFFRDHYSVISLDDLENAYNGNERLPPRPLLITFDDGWADNYDYALPVLRGNGLPAALFVASDSIDRREAFFQERVIGWWRTGQLKRPNIEAAWRIASPDDDIPADPLCEEAVRQLVARLQEVPVDERQVILSELGRDCKEEAREMLTADELCEMYRSGIMIGTHGKKHEPLTKVPDLLEELVGSRCAVAGALGVDVSNIKSMSFPFSRTNRFVVDKASEVGYELMFGGGRSITPITDGGPRLLARVGITESEISDSLGNLLAHRLANQLFRQPHGFLEA